MIYFFSFSTVVANALARFNDVAENGRSEIWHNSWPLVGQYFPWGSGLGSFVSAYAAREPLDQVSIYYVNSPHNEYLGRSEEHTSELQSLMRISYAVFCLKKKNSQYDTSDKQHHNR